MDEYRLARRVLMADASKGRVIRLYPNGYPVIEAVSKWIQLR